MAARLRKTHQDDVSKKFYVYELVDDQGKVAYVGKGSGRRLIVQKAKHLMDGRVVASFAVEADAYAYEVKHIAKMVPYLNKCKGGNGCTVTVKRVVKQPWERLMQKIGTQAYAARLLLAFGAPDPSIVGELRKVAAYG